MRSRTLLLNIFPFMSFMRKNIFTNSQSILIKRFFLFFKMSSDGDMVYIKLVEVGVTYRFLVDEIFICCHLKCKICVASFMRDEVKRIASIRSHGLLYRWDVRKIMCWVRGLEFKSYIPLVCVRLCGACVWVPSKIRNIFS